MHGRRITRIIRTRYGYQLRNTANDDHRGWWDKPASWASQWPLLRATFVASIATGAGVVAGKALASASRDHDRLVSSIVAVPYRSQRCAAHAG